MCTQGYIDRLFIFVFLFNFIKEMCRIFFLFYGIIILEINTN
jgi:hypothetical protein